MEIKPAAVNAKASAGETNRQHEERVSPAGVVSDSYFALIHTPVPIGKAKQIPEARAALQKERKKLEARNAWDLSSVRERKDVEAEVRNTRGGKVHFGSLMELCHIKGSEKQNETPQYKGRIVFRGDIVQDETGYYAVFSEQGTSAAHQAAAKFLDAIARLPGCSGSDSDAIGAYTQVLFEEIHEKVMKQSGQPLVETWISLPKEYQPPDWEKKYQEPVVLLKRNLYGHPLAGWYWEIYAADILTKHGFEKVPGWECIWVHKAKGLFVSVYVDDFKMAGRKEEEKEMWKTLKENLDLEDPVPLDGSTY